MKITIKHNVNLSIKQINRVTNPLYIIKPTLIKTIN
jgi:hypothetical protein